MAPPPPFTPGTLPVSDEVGLYTAIGDATVERIVLACKTYYLVSQGTTCGTDSDGNPFVVGATALCVTRPLTLEAEPGCRAVLEAVPSNYSDTGNRVMLINARRITDGLSLMHDGIVYLERIDIQRGDAGTTGYGGQTYATGGGLSIYDVTTRLDDVNIFNNSAVSASHNHSHPWSPV